MDDPAPLRVLIVAQPPVARVGLSGLVAEGGEAFAVVGQSASLAGAGQTALDLQPDLVLAAWEPSGFEDLTDLIETVGRAGIPVVLLGEAPSPRALQAVLRAGGRGFLLPDATAEELGAALQAVGRGLLALDPALVHTLAATPPLSLPDELGETEPLTEREHQVLELIALGLPNKAIAHRLGISEHTVKFHLGSILAKLDAGSRTEAVTRAIRLGVLAL